MSVSRGERGQRNLAWLFEGPSGASKREVWNWWQQRRLRYNRDVFLVGLATWILVLVAGSAAVQPGEDFEEPLMMIFGPLLYALFANLAYTAGPVLDTVYFHAAPRRGLFKAGYISSLVLTALPGVWAVVAWHGSEHKAIHHASKTQACAHLLRDRARKVGVLSSYLQGEAPSGYA